MGQRSGPSHHNYSCVRKTKMYFEGADRAGFEINGECTVRTLQYSHFFHIYIDF